MTFSTFGGMWGTIKAMIFNSYANPAAQQQLDEIKQDNEKKVSLPVVEAGAA